MLGQAKSRRCSTCSIGYPPFVEVCRVCGDRTWVMYKNDPDEDWEDQVKRLMGEAVYLESKPEAPYPHPSDAKVPLFMSMDRLWLGHDDLLSAGYACLEPDKIVFVGGRFYELQGFSKRLNSWWVEEIIAEGAADDLRPEMFEQWKFDE